MSQPPAPDPAAEPVPGGATWAEAPGLVARGACMGMADVIPGVSGGTMALILGIYVRLVEAIKSFDVQALRDLARLRLQDLHARVAWRFLGMVVCGQALGVILFTKGLRVPALLHSHPEPVYGVFFGLVLGSVFLLGRDVVHDGPVRGRLLGAGGVGLLLGVAVAMSTRQATPQAPWFVFLAGCVAISAMILPGISGSFVLLLLRQYEHVLGGLDTFLSLVKGETGPALHALEVIVIPFALGCLTGIVLFSRLLSKLLRVARQETMAAMVGLLVGSLAVVWPFQERIYETVHGKSRFVGSAGLQLPRADGSSALALALIVVGLVLVLGLDRAARGRSDKLTT